MVSQGPNSPSTSVDGGDAFTAWTNPGNTVSSNDVYATNAGAVYNRLLITGFGFGVSGTITDISVEIEGMVSTGTLGFFVNLTKDGTSVAATQQSKIFNTTEAYKIYGTPPDLWGTTWTAAEINAATFGVITLAQLGSGTMSIDHVRITITYTPDSGKAQTQIRTQAINRSNSF